MCEILRPPPPLIVVADPSSVVNVSVVSVMLLSSMVAAVDMSSLHRLREWFL